MSKLFKIYILFLFLMIINISSINAENTVISNSTCRSNSFGTVGHQDYARWNDGCSNGQNSSITNGMAQCAIETAKSQGLPDRKIFRRISDDNKYVHVIVYDIGRIDAWSDSNGIWEKNSSFGRPSCQGMDITYISTSDISDYLDTNNLDGLELLSIQKTNLNDTFNGSSVYRDNEKYFLESWRANIYDISGGTLTGDKFSYNVSVTSLGTNGGPNGLGFNGTTQDRYSGGSRAYHYYIPFRIEFRYKNSEYNPCIDPDPKVAREYAYSNPGVCCVEYPQTCCGNADFMNSYFSITDWRFAACCEDSTVKEINDTEIYAYNTFKYYM